MSVYAISDWHLSINNPKPMDIFGGAWNDYVGVLTENLNGILTDGDILLIAGDISWAMHLENAKPDLDFIAGFKGRKVILRGNHDYWWKSVSAVREAAGANTFAVQNDSVKLDDIIIAGSRGWIEPESAGDEKIYAREVLRIKMSLLDAAKKREAGDKLIVMTHYPPFGMKDYSPFTEAIKEANATAVVYGHIHSRNYKKDIVSVIDGIPYYLTSCDILKNLPVKII
jgi:predicted phosphohydrolase